MIIDRIGNAGLYAADRKLDRALRYLAETDFRTMAPGRIEIDGPALFALVQAPTMRVKEAAQFEAHRKYIDVQYVVDGVEAMGWAPRSTLATVVPYHADSDTEMLAGDGDLLTVRAGFFVVFYPEDAHMPCLSAGGCPAPQRKVVVKLAVD